MLFRSKKTEKQKREKQKKEKNKRKTKERKKQQQKLKIELPHDPAIPLLGIHPEKTIIQKVTCTPMFIAALFTIDKTWKQPKCPSTNEWIKKMWYIYTTEY